MFEYKYTRKTFSKVLCVVLLTTFKVTQLQASCSSHSDCLALHSCCKETRYGRYGECALNCIGKSCISNGDCGNDERCHNYICGTTPSDGECDTEKHCPTSKPHCCQILGSPNVCSTICLRYACSSDVSCEHGEYCVAGTCGTKFEDGECNSDLDCKSYQYCCERTGPNDNTCASNCIFDSCNEDSHCAHGECCDSDNQCVSICNRGLTTWVLAIIVIMIAIAVAGVVSLWLRYCRGSRGSRRGPGRVTYRTTTTMTTQDNQSQQPMAPHPPPQYPPSQQQHPHVSQPYPPTHQQQPPTHQPYPPTQEPYPPTHQPYPPTHQPYPPTHQPYPPTQQPYPPTHKPYPPTQQLYPQEPPPPIQYSNDPLPNEPPPQYAP